MNEKQATLREYLNMFGMTQQGFADKSGICRRTIVYILEGKKVKKLTAKIIEQETEGFVKAESIRIEPKERKSK